MFDLCITIIIAVQQSRNKRTKPIYKECSTFYRTAKPLILQFILIFVFVDLIAYRSHRQPIIIIWCVATRTYKLVQRIRIMCKLKEWRIMRCMANNEFSEKIVYFDSFSLADWSRLQFSMLIISVFREPNQIPFNLRYICYMRAYFWLDSFKINNFRNWSRLSGMFANFKCLSLSNSLTSFNLNHLWEFGWVIWNKFL